MPKNYKIKSTDVNILVKQAKVYGIKDTVHLIYHQLKILKEKNRNIIYLIRLKKLDYYIDNYENYKKKELYNLILTGLRNINLTHLEDYNALVYFLEELIKENE